MNTTYRYHPAISDLSALKPGNKVWIVFETFKPGLWMTAQRFYVGQSQHEPECPRLSLDSGLLNPVTHLGPIWTNRAGAIEKLLDIARGRAAAAKAEVDRLEFELRNCVG